MSVNVCPDEIFWTTEHFVTKHRMVMQHHEPECHAEMFAIFKDKSQWGLLWSKYDSFYCIFWTFDSSATKLGLMMHHHKLECLVKNILLLHSWSRSLWRVKMSMFVQMISSKLPNILWPNLVLWCIVTSQSVVQKDCCAIFKVKATARAHVIKMWQFLYMFWPADPFAPRLGLIVHCHKPECLRRHLIAVFKSRSQQNFKLSMNICLDNIVRITEPLTTKLCMVMHHHELDCLPK